MSAMMSYEPFWTALQRTAHSHPCAWRYILSVSTSKPMSWMKLVSIIITSFDIHTLLTSIHCQNIYCNHSYVTRSLNEPVYIKASSRSRARWISLTPTTDFMKAFRRLLTAQKPCFPRPLLFQTQNLNEITRSRQVRYSSTLVSKMPELDVIKTKRLWWKESVVYQVGARKGVWCDQRLRSCRSIQHRFETQTEMAMAMSVVS